MATVLRDGKATNVSSDTVLGQTSKVDTVVTDKTGAMTEGRPVLTDVPVVGGADPDDLLGRVAVAEAVSSHPLSVAAGVFYTSLGWSNRPEISALPISMSSVFVAMNAVFLKRVEHTSVIVRPATDRRR